MSAWSPQTAQAVTQRLQRAGCVAADDEAAELLAAAPDRPTLEAWISRREQGEPLAWITGSVTFGGREVRVDPGVYVPRAQTEELAARAAGLLGAPGRLSTRRAADLCTGTGAVASHLAATVPGAVVVGTDIDPRAVACARRNGVPALVASLDGGLRGQVFDVVTAVAPYVPTRELRLLPADVQRYEPQRALDGGPDGLTLVRRVVTGAGRLLRGGGWLLIELGAEQDVAVEPFLASNGFGPPEVWHDEDGDLRGLAAQRAAGKGPR